MSLEGEREWRESKIDIFNGKKRKIVQRSRSQANKINTVNKYLQPTKRHYQFDITQDMRCEREQTRARGGVDGVVYALCVCFHVKCDLVSWNYFASCFPKNIRFHFTVYFYFSFILLLVVVRFGVSRMR